MRFLESIRDRFVGGLAGAQMGADGLSRIAESIEIASMENQAGVNSKESIAELEMMEEDISWRDLQSREHDFSRDSLRKIINRSRVMYLINPLIRRAVTLQELYVWGSGVNIKAETPAVDEVIQAFFTDPKNQKVIGQAWPEREREQRIDGNTFLAFFVNTANGTARVRILPVQQVSEIICNPEDATEPWYYCRNMPSGPDVTSQGAIDNGYTVGEKCLYPDIDYNPDVKPKFDKALNCPIMWNTRILHIKTGGLSSMRFGVPELYSAMNWATGYKRILENFATTLAAYARLAMQLVNLPNKKNIAAAKSRLNTTALNGSRDNNPAPNTAAWAAMSGNAELKPIKTAGSTTGPDEARALRCMVAAGSDVPEHFFGDSDVGTFATSSTLDRPTELKMVARQRMWMLVIINVCMKLIEWSAAAPKGALRTAGYRAKITLDPFDNSRLIKVTAPAESSLKVVVTFPTILERDVTDRVRSVVQAATLGGSPAEGIIPDRKLLFKLLMVALGEKDAEALMEKYYPEPVLQGFADPADRVEDEHLAAQGKKELGDAALAQAAAAKKTADKPTPKPSNPAPAVSNK